MPVTRRLARTRAAALVAALTAATVGATGLSAAQAAGSAKPGLIGGKVVLQDHASFSGYDAASDAAGNTYIGWIGDPATGDANRQVYLCTLPPGAEACKGGVQVIPSLDVAGSDGLRVLTTASGLVTLVWSHDAPYTGLGRDGRIAVATSQSGGPLSAATDVADAPSQSTLYDAELGPGGSLWTVTGVGALASSIEVREGVTNPAITVATPYLASDGYLAFAGTTPVIAIQKDGAVSTAPDYTHGVAGGFAAWRPLGTTWTASANIGMVSTTTGVRIITSIGNANYWPVVAKYSAGTFGKAVFNGNNADCAPGSHDLNADASGRLVDVSTACSNVTVSDMPGTTVSGRFTFASGGTIASGIPQISTTPRGHGVVIWSIESGTADRLYFSRLLLPGADTSVSKSGVTVTGPISCQPASTIAVSVKGSRAGYSVSSASLSFGGKKLAAKATIDGSKLTGGKVYALTGKVVFTNGRTTSSGSVTLKFRSCINP